MSPIPQAESFTSTLCTQCGLCCDGSLFDDVELAGRREESALEILGLDVDDDEGGLLLQPCRALDGTRCSIYPHRPEGCRTFECRVLQEVKRGSMDRDRALQQIAEARGRVAEVRRLAAALGPKDTHLPLKELYIEALAHSDGRAEEARLRKRLDVAMRAVERLVRRVFLESDATRSSRQAAPRRTGREAGSGD